MRQVDETQCGNITESLMVSPSPAPCASETGEDTLESRAERREIPAGYCTLLARPGPVLEHYHAEDSSFECKS